MKRILMAILELTLGETAADSLERIAIEDGLPKGQEVELAEVLRQG